ncbi:hypothetical protein A2303_01300 [Candidatus Falkowbacteria bacterium RIFOXYB2_FULL_47_14]|uniref:VWFA domain-containing protein n=1 Tax=Candidatus Falkowbacteria bacterium RIFOXYA2_FULL_47_19 TaxID=1797994 RepID=A0A1F5SGU7_9BACT|nr:MAG: hypothetical protein A2227_05595 [Candidatus Falkowbacteria bacterium RIFOXYA2_FULL_47_19]OGF34488.1 MAG: hypothetical protein A2468_04640 [Candidatus Falkowbacteria bacterium RIFOXYC2_FULL_46_15]OGF43527.1 MAG: hypothetical protein A2303_01300 [Candidatus Falkowbacteria bacterium RIFOXYB2_FULL_47_14]
MGDGDDYVGSVPRRESIREEDFNFSGFMNRGTGQRECHPEMNIKGKIRECRDNPKHPETTPIAVIIDLTRSRGKDTMVVRRKIARLIGQIIKRSYLPGPTLSIGGVGDATDGDRAPVQIGQFEVGNILDRNLNEYLWIEEGGGGSGRESYELAAYAYATRTDLDANKRGKKGICIILGDEGFYPLVKKEQIKEHLGADVPADIPAAEAFRLLQEKYHVFFIYVRKPWTEHKKDVDKEIMDRVLKAGGMHGGVDVRASLLWNDYNDLDLHVISPSGEEIMFNHRRSRCGGELDVDRNAGGRETRKPIENIRWPKGKAPAGRYRVIVQNYNFHEDKRGPIPFKVEVEVNGEVKHFEGIAAPQGNETGSRSNIAVHDFEFDPEKRPGNKDQGDVYRQYGEEVVKAQWESVLPKDRIITIVDPEAVVDTMLGIVAGLGGVDLKTFISHLKSDGQSDVRMAQVSESLAEFFRALNVPKTAAPKLPSRQKKKPGKTKRLD